jgi:tRNA threonylcarbamoyladenosine biosynthesis protein TsaB
MRILALETSGDACSVALLLDSAIHQRFELAPQRHTELLLPMLEALCAGAGVALQSLDGIAVSCGPGAFTGVRIAASMAQGLALAHGLPVIPVSTLAALAVGGHRLGGETRWMVVQDARRQEVYWAEYLITLEPVAAELLGTEAVGPPASVVLPATGSFGIVGSGWSSYGQLIPGTTAQMAASPLLWPEARDVAVLGAHGLARGLGLAPEALAPVYLRPPV